MLLNCKSETRRWAGHVTALQTSADGNAKTSLRSCTRPKEHAVWPSEHFATWKKCDCPSDTKKQQTRPTNARTRKWHEQWDTRRTKKSTDESTNENLTFASGPLFTSLECTRHRATDVSWWERNGVSKIQISSIAETVRKCYELRPHYVLHKSHAEILATSDQRTLLCTHDLCVIQSDRVTVPQCGTKPSWNKNIA